MANIYEHEMYSYFNQLNDEEQQSVVNMLKAFIKNRTRSSENISIEQYNLELEKAKQQIEAGDFVTQEDLEKEMEEW